MAVRRVYYNEKHLDYPHLNVHKNADNELFVGLEGENFYDCVFTTIPYLDAVKLIYDLAKQFNIKIETPQS